jgi:hypothetical protein
MKNQHKIVNFTLSSTMSYSKFISSFSLPDEKDAKEYTLTVSKEILIQIERTDGCVTSAEAKIKYTDRPSNCFKKGDVIGNITLRTFDNEVKELAVKNIQNQFFIVSCSGVIGFTWKPRIIKKLEFGQVTFYGKD